MTLKAYSLRPVDSWFFRDGRPFNQGEKTQTDVQSMFPPFATTVVGAIRASLARSMSWKGYGDWSAEIKAKLGDGQNLKPLKFQGPYLIRNMNGRIDPLFPAPLSILGKPSSDEEKSWTFASLSPVKEGINCDLGKGVRLPAAKNATGMMSLNGFFLTQEDMGLALHGEDLQGINPIPANSLWELEYSVGIARNCLTRTAEEGMIYSAQKVRLRHEVALAMHVGGLDNETKLQTTLLLGGESRMAYSEQLARPVDMIEAPALQSSGGVIRLTVTHITPAYFDGGLPGPGKELPGVSGAKVISACLERPLRIGGWDSVPDKNGIRKGPISLRPFIPPGSTWFCEAETGLAEKIRKLNGCHIGGYSDFGFGQILIGSWKEDA
jgi:CRISPR-associated protein Cmr3